MLRNLEDERMRMVRPRTRRQRGDGGTAAAGSARGGWHGARHRGVRRLQAPVPLPSPTTEPQGRAEGREGELGVGGTLGEHQ